MLSLNSRIILFIIGCIGTRIILTIIAKNINIKFLPYLGVLALLPAIGFSYIYITGSRKSGFEAGGKIWWNSMRPIHSILYFLFAYNAIHKRQDIAWKFLAIDVTIGLIAFLNHHLF
jgi:hypothetical protein